MPEKFRFDMKSLKKEGVLSSSSWYMHSWGGGSEGKKREKRRSVKAVTAVLPSGSEKLREKGRVNI